MKSPRNLLVRTAVALALIIGHAAQSKPLPGGVLEVLGLERALSSRPGGRLTPADEDKLMQANGSGVTYTRMAAAYILTNSDSPKGTDALTSLLSDPDPWVAATAQFSAIRRELASLGDEELAPIAASRMAKTKEGWTRVLLASWLGDRCGVAIVSPFLTELRAETNNLVRAELLFQIATHANMEQLKAAREALEQPGGVASAGFSESDAQFLNAISSNPVKRSTIPGFLERIVESRLAEKQ
jgi:HEAT repeat protein